ncbi:MAG: hypothetical protein MJY98_04585 [Fibrobacter sp.]|nr:hypothetical protein [Fibrobacter sp.]
MEDREFFKAIAANVSKIKLPNGFVGKITILLLVIVVVLAILAVKADCFGLYVAAFAVITILAFVALFKLTDFANKNPQAALLEGGEFILLQKMQLASKNNSQVGFDNKNPMLDPNSQLEIVNSADAERPDEKENDGGN